MSAQNLVVITAPVSQGIPDTTQRPQSPNVRRILDELIQEHVDAARASELAERAELIKLERRLRDGPHAPRQAA